MRYITRAKVNLGLHVVEKRPDGYHNIETVFYPIGLHDTLDIELVSASETLSHGCCLEQEGMALDCDPSQNLVVKAYNMLAQHHTLPAVRVRLHKNIPSQAGLGGGSGNAAAMLLAMNEIANLHLSVTTLKQYAAQLGADCAFFIESVPAFATGIGDCLTPLSQVIPTLPAFWLQGCWMGLVKPDVAVSTKEAYAGVTPQRPLHSCCEVLAQPIDRWKELLTNDFELSVFAIHPVLATVKRNLYEKGALYAQMSGSGSTVFGIFEQCPDDFEKSFPGMFSAVLPL